MTAKEKAKELVERFKNHSYMDWNENIGFDYKEQTENAKQCALICVDEIKEIVIHLHPMMKQELNFNYWEDVKQEIELL